MIVYNVTVSVENAVVDAWVKWMKEEHMPELMAMGLFTDSRLCRLLEQDEVECVTYSAQYTCKSMAEYNTYIDKYATNMREKSFRQFGSSTIAFRTLMEII